MAYVIRFRRPRTKIPLPAAPKTSKQQEEVLTGVVQEKKASAPEERLAWVLMDEKIPFLFRYVFGAPVRNMPGWKELDFVILHDMVYLVEVDTEFTHRKKSQLDILHDTLALNDPKIKRMGQVYPQVIHIDGNKDLYDKESAKRFVRRTF